jgi:cell fate regulator YaaT (PSP1 superfamily)
MNENKSTIHEPEVGDKIDLESFAKPSASKKNHKVFINENFESLFTVSKIKHKDCDENKVYPYAEVIFKCKRRRLFNNEREYLLKPPQYVIVEVENGLDIGTISAAGECAMEKFNCYYKSAKPKFSIIRHAHKDDISQLEKNIEDENRVVELTRQLSERYQLDIKVTDAEWQFDKQRLTIYFTAPQRVDFRDLVKDLARTFRTRIELRQISSREEAKRIGGMGPCGRKLCCSSFASEFNHVTLDHARTQQLSNNVAKLSGYCGRLKCCLLYEYDNYVETFKKYPPLNCTIKIKEGIARIMKIDIFKDIVHLHIDESGVYKSITYDELMELKDQGNIRIPKNGGYHHHIPIHDSYDDDLEDPSIFDE